MEPWIPLDGHQPTRPFRQTLGQDARTGTDLDDDILWSDVCRANNEIANCSRDKETLSKTSFRQQAVLAEQRAGLMPEGWRPIRMVRAVHSVKRHRRVLVPG